MRVVSTYGDSPAISTPTPPVCNWRYCGQARCIGQPADLSEVRSIYHKTYSFYPSTPPYPSPSHFDIRKFDIRKFDILYSRIILYVPVLTFFISGSLEQCWCSVQASYWVLQQRNQESDLWYKYCCWDSRCNLSLRYDLEFFNYYSTLLIWPQHPQGARMIQPSLGLPKQHGTVQCSSETTSIVCLDILLPPPPPISPNICISLERSSRHLSRYFLGRPSFDYFPGMSL